MPAARESTPPARAPRRDDAISTLASLLFIAWCFVVGTLLLYAPWMPVWARLAASFSDPALQEFFAHPTVRGAICGFGLFHLVYGTHDLDALIARFLHRRVEAAEETEADRERSPEEPTKGDAGEAEGRTPGASEPDRAGIPGRGGS